LTLPTLSSDERRRRVPFLTVPVGTHCISRSFPLPSQRMPASPAAASAAPGPAPHAHPAVSKRPRNQRVRMPSRARSACPENTIFCIWQPCARDSGNKIAASAYGMGSGGLVVDAMAIGCLGVDRRGKAGLGSLTGFSGRVRPALLRHARSLEIACSMAPPASAVSPNRGTRRPCINLA
jgi:hypothetical protein